jgi:pyruvate dehydrogenase E1 component alpha subunit/2-oxoisovalerate dehydrogenase E1 component alpha subunit
MNLAAVEHLPLVVVVVNNQYAYSTCNARQFACRNLVDRAAGYGVAGHEVEGTDLLACARVIGGAVRRARAGDGPQMVVAEILRLAGHGEHDDAFYVSEELRQSNLGRDCVEVALRQLLEGGFASAGEVADWRQRFTDEVQEAVAQAQREPLPDPFHESWQAVATDGVFVSDWVETSDWERSE